MSPTDLPTGTVTFLFTDIEGSTKHLGKLGDRYPPLLEEHQRLLREAFSGAGGVEVSTEGDAFFVVFPNATDAVRGAVDAQRALASHDWPEEAQIRVRIGIHTGEGILGGDNYAGIDVHRAARVMSAGHGGQILITEATHALTARSVPAGVTFREIGVHRLKDLDHPERLFQVAASGLDEDFPAPRTLSARPGNLPEQLTTFIGRRQEVEGVKNALSRTRLLTLTGPGGTGKTRLSLQVAGEVRDDFENGAFFVALGPLSDPDLVPTTIAQALGLREDPARPVIETLVEDLRDKSMLLLLDNFEQIIDGGRYVSEILAACSNVKALVTSREVLHLHGEHEYPVPPLALPDPADLPPLASLTQYEAVALFIDRAVAVKPEFAITNENAPAVAELAARLDGLPLAIELAAAGIKLLNPAAILKRLENRLMGMGQGARDLPARQQTLRGAIAWSYDLLEPQEQQFFAALSVFRGGATLEAIEAVAAQPSGIDAFDAVASLVNKSLLRQVDMDSGDPRFSMLETIREFAEEQLAQSPETAEVHERHAAYFLEMAESAAADIYGPKQSELLDALGREHDNFRAALTWTELHKLPTALRMGGALWRFWQMRGHLREASERLSGIVAHPEAEQHPEEFAIALEGAGGIFYWMGDWDPTRDYYSRALELRRAGDDKAALAEALYNMSFVYSVAPGEKRDAERSRQVAEEALAIYRELGDRGGEAKTHWAMSNVFTVQGQWDKTREASTQALDIFRELNDRFSLAWTLHSVGLSASVLGDFESAEAPLTESLEIFEEAGDVTGIALLLADFAQMEARRGDGPRAARLRGASLASEAKSGQGLVSNFDDILGQFEEVILGVIPPDEYEKYLKEGWAMSLEEAVDYALRR